ncbi:IQ and ubiquitin-like domain-containing protein [Physella acuta]|uniref:IQ and ubiquitin-like domain-containing protein n=1 Tax=Physella acuta TaxID=109671 RepID=UPI0027DBEED2|nr:IQ and ubiquitin-like domain-containing protein [Physella acuta]XP_059171768.1 IQ and ubiquitin-like domain-containing protein [Physella acuta]
MAEEESEEVYDELNNEENEISNVEEKVEEVETILNEENSENIQNAENGEVTYSDSEARQDNQLNEDEIDTKDKEDLENNADAVTEEDLLEGDVELKNSEEEANHNKEQNEQFVTGNNLVEDDDGKEQENKVIEDNENLNNTEDFNSNVETSNDNVQIIPDQAEENMAGTYLIEHDNDQTVSEVVKNDTGNYTQDDMEMNENAVNGNGHIEDTDADGLEIDFNQSKNIDTDSSSKVGTEVRTPQQESQRVVPLDKKFRVNLDATATVKFVMMPSGQVVTLACTLGKTLEELKSHFAYELKMPSSLIMLLFDGKDLSSTVTLAELGVGPNGTVQLEIQSADPLNAPLKPYRPHQEYHMPDVITVRVVTEDCETKDVVVEIERARCKKPFLGGFRNKNTGIEYHNASAQTVQKQRPPATLERFCRDTQTCEQKNTLQQTMNTTSTQMTGVGFFVSNAEDKLIQPGEYCTADEYWALVLSKVIILQKNYRRWLAKRYVKKLKEDKEKRLAWERNEELRKKLEKEERIKREYARRINPQSKSDFDMLLHCLEKWRLEEIERINTTLTGAERKAALCMLLDQETELLSAIERHKNEASLENRDKRIMAFLEKAAAPKKWAGHDGKLTYMDTPYTVRAKELRDIYNSINMKYLTQDERLDVLLTLKHTVKEHDCKLTQEIIELIDREADLLMRGVKESNLTGLRKRISTLFLQYIKTPTFNPEAAKLLKVPQDPSTLRKNINYCHSCGSYLPSTEFFITSNTSNVGRCRKCEKIENDGRQRQDHNYYRVMLKALRKSEEAIQDGSSICYLLQEIDLRYLVENIWSNQSVLSAWDDIYDLTLVRWDKHQEWSPWNCILLTHDEAEAHKKLFSLEEGYGQVFIHKVTQKHNFARNYFSRLPGMSEILRKKIGAAENSAANAPAVSGHTVPKSQKV